ncbi:NAD(P)/FAD-dependent oxidoreductase [Mycobacterium paraintracellulare]|uniref:NAD(P)/FAD-dependent oxidoreductase n=1 Tax=Mycobacterium paraintracellulare TaxID=1138383 RepID=UPI001929121A|nr:FAD/NAD(P)-binding oxidoreductase [Mycobacterium paraintracellulare]BCP14201.1 ferredoxin reductase [Mycobacterium paraintracellulare]
MVALQRVVVVGAGLAGHRAVDELRRSGFGGELIVIGDERHKPYDRPPLSKELLYGGTRPQHCEYKSLDADWRLGQAAVGLDAAASTVTLADGRALTYDGLLIATGRRARPWPTSLPALEGFHTLRTVDDALRLRAAVQTTSHVAIIGAGFIGCEVAAALRRCEISTVAFIESASHPMPLLGAEVGARAARIHDDHGVDLQLGTSVASFEGRGHVQAVVLTNGKRIEADLVLIAIGSTPNSDWLVDSGLELVDGNVLCNSHCMAVGVDNVAVAGDIATWAHSGVNQLVRVEHWTNARDMGAAAAANLLTTPERRLDYAPVPSFWSDQYDVKIKSVGFVSSADSIKIIDEDLSRSALVAEAYRDGELVGAITLNRNRTILDYQRTLAQSYRRMLK